MEESNRRTEPDVDILTPSNGPPPAGGGTATATLTRPGVFEMPVVTWPDEEITEAFVEVRTTGDDERLVTSIEVLSPSNKKPGMTGRGMYLSKQAEMRVGGINLVEIDLLRSGAHTTVALLEEMRRRIGAYDYHICVSPADRNKTCLVTPVRLADALPEIDIPLTPEAGTVPVALQTILDRCYDEAGYTRRVRYDRPCDPPLSDEQRAWAEGVLRAKGLIP
jgi:hypothetical protein